MQGAAGRESERGRGGKGKSKSESKSKSKSKSKTEKWYDGVVGVMGVRLESRAHLS